MEKEHQCWGILNDERLLLSSCTSLVFRCASWGTYVVYGYVDDLILWSHLKVLSLYLLFYKGKIFRLPTPIIHYYYTLRLFACTLHPSAVSNIHSAHTSYTASHDLLCWPSLPATVPQTSHAFKETHFLFMFGRFTTNLVYTAKMKSKFNK